MTEYPILFNGEMVRAILEGRKTQTRRVIGRLPYYDSPSNRWLVRGKGRISLQFNTEKDAFAAMPIVSPYCRAGNRLWVRETFCPIYPQDPDYNDGRPIEYDYAATYKHGDRMGDLIGEKKKWKPSIHMPRDACRLLLDVVSVRMERLQDISEEDARAEGAKPYRLPAHPLREGLRHVDGFAQLWQSINGADSWDANPWVWVIEFKKGGAA